MKNYLNYLTLLFMGGVMMNPFNSKETIITPKSPVKQTYSLPMWVVGKYKIFAKNEKDALKYAKKRGLWDGVSQPKMAM